MPSPRCDGHATPCIRARVSAPASPRPPAQVARHTDADERFVFLLSDANLERYGIRPTALASVLSANPSVHAHAIFLSSVGGEAERLRAALPAGRASICLDAKEVPKAFKTSFQESVLHDS